MKNSILLENGSVLKVQRVRQRKIYSCVICHTKKIKCSKDHPQCSRCAKYNLNCEYYVNDRVSRRPQKKGSIIKPSAKLSNEITNKKQLKIEAKNLPQQEEEITMNNKPEKQLPTPPNTIDSPVEHPKQDELHTSPIELPLEPPKDEYTLLIELIRQSCPNAEESKYLLENYEENMRLKLPIIDFEEFKKHYNLFLKNPNQPLEFILIYFLILLASSTQLNNIYKTLQFNNIISKIFDHMKFPLSSTNYSLKNVQLYTAYLTILPFPTIESVSSLIKIALLYELDRDPVIHHHESDVNLVQFQRLLWWQIVCLDAKVAVLRNQAPIINMNKVDTSLPSELDLMKNIIPEIVIANANFRYVNMLLDEFVIITNSDLSLATLESSQQKISDLYVSCNASIVSLNTFVSQNPVYEKSIESAIFELKTIPDKASIALKRLMNDDDVIFADLRSVTNRSEKVFFNYQRYSINKGFEYVFCHFIDQILNSEQKLVLAPLYQFYTITCLLTFLVEELFEQINSYDNSFDSLIEFLKENLKFNVINKLIFKNYYCPLEKTTQFEISALVSEIFTLIKLYPIKYYNDDRSFRNVEEYLNYYGLNDYSVKCLEFVESHEAQSLQYLDNSTNINPNSNDNNNLDYVNSNINGNIVGSGGDGINTISCSDIAPRSMTALAAVNTMRDINVFEETQSMDPIFDETELEDVNVNTNSDNIFSNSWDLSTNSMEDEKFNTGSLKILNLYFEIECPLDEDRFQYLKGKLDNDVEDFIKSKKDFDNPTEFSGEDYFRPLIERLKWLLQKF